MRHDLKDDKIEIIQVTVFSLVCVPAGMPDEEVERRVNTLYTCGTTNGWKILKNGSDPERVDCENDPSTGRQHIVVVC